MALTKKRTVVLKGNPIYNEEGTATATVKPGHLVKGVSSIAHQSVSDGTPVPLAVACERSEFGAGIDNTYQGSGTPSAFYASGDQVKVAVFKAGEEAVLFLASGAGTVNEDTLLQSAGDGTVKVRSSSNYVVARSKETLGAIVALTAVRVEFM